MKTVTVTRTVTRKQDIQVPLNEVKHTEIIGMSMPQLRQYASAMRMLMKDTFNTGSDLTEHPQQDIDNRKEVDEILKNVVWWEQENPEPDSTRGLGVKRGKTSKYHLIYLSDKKGIWTAAIKDKKQSAYLGSYDNEREAALVVDAYLDNKNDIKRPRNRDEFPEIMELYKIQQENNK